jgi:hypothetical protein
LAQKFEKIRAKGVLSEDRAMMRQRMKVEHSYSY